MNNDKSKGTLSDFDFVLPSELIAQKPVAKRSMSRLLQLNSLNSYTDKHFIDIVDDFVAGDVLILNDTKVVPARLHGYKQSGGKLEIFVERVQSDVLALCMLKFNHAPKVGDIIILGDLDSGLFAEIIDRQQQFFLLKLLQNEWHSVLDAIGDIPLPPYINRAPDNNDVARYQTVYAKYDGAVAAPTAGLHFSDELLSTLKNKGVEIAFVTLHVGAGTFLPVKTDDISKHIMHYERYVISQATADLINKAKLAGNNVTAVGTTSLRALESSAKNGLLVAESGDTNLFVTPGYEFQIVDRLITNFHLPKSTLMMLVCAFAGYNEIMNAYQHAVAQKYRFFSYGDAMLLKCKKD